MTFDGGTGVVSGTLRVEKADAGTILPLSVPVRGPTGTVMFNRSGALATGSLALGTADGTITFVAGWEDAGVVAALSIMRDTSAPILTVTVLDRPDAGDADPADPGAWKKDERALVRVVVDEPNVSVTTTHFSVPWLGPVTAVAPSACACVAPGCSCFELDLAATTVNGIRGSQNFNVGPVTDGAGNISAVPVGNVRVTRFKWQRQIGVGSVATAIPTPVAVSENGLVVAGTTEAAPFRLVALAQSGTTRWSSMDAGTVTSGPVLSSSEAWVGTQAAFSQLQPTSLSSGALGTPDCIQAATAAYEGELGLATVSTGGGTGERPMGVRGGQLRVADGTCNASALSGFVSPAHVVLQEGSGVTAFVAGGGASLWKAHLDTAQTWAGQGTAAFTVAPARGLFTDGMYVGGSGGGVTSGGAFSTGASAALSGTTMFGYHQSALAPQAGPPSLGADYLLYGDSSGRLVKVSFTAGVLATTAETAVTIASGSSTIETTPIIGEGGHLYTVAADGTLVVNRVSALTEEWRANTFFPVGSSRIGQPALDVLRTAGGGKDCRGLGVLYVSSSLSGVAALTAVIVDSQGLEGTAPWPKFQRDNANTGNISRPITHWTCP